MSERVFDKRIPWPRKFIHLMFHSDVELHVAVTHTAHIQKIPRELILQHLNKNQPFLKMLNRRRVLHEKLLSFMTRRMASSSACEPIWDELIETGRVLPGFVNNAALELSTMVNCPECEGSGEDLEDSSRECFLCHGIGKMKRHEAEAYGEEKRFVLFTDNPRIGLTGKPDAEVISLEMLHERGAGYSLEDIRGISELDVDGIWHNRSTKETLHGVKIWRVK